jgi:hypothetical protein
LPEMTNEEATIQFDEDVDMPELIPRQADDDSVSESSNDSEDEDERKGGKQSWKLKKRWKKLCKRIVVGHLLQEMKTEGFH